MNWLRKLFGVKKCATLDDLIAYIPVGDLAALWNWIDWWIPYKKDKDLSENWLPAAEVVRRAAKGIGDDCEGIHGVAFAVINSPKWQAKGWEAQLAVLDRPEPPRHAICTFVRPDGIKGYVNYGVHLFPGASWVKVFESMPGGWTDAWWVDEQGHRLPRVGAKLRAV